MLPITVCLYHFVCNTVLLVLKGKKIEPVHEISNNVVGLHQQSLRAACAYAQTDQSLCWSLEYSMSVKLLTEPYLKILILKGDCTGSSDLHLSKCNIIENHMSRLFGLLALLVFMQ